MTTDAMRFTDQDVPPAIHSFPALPTGGFSPFEFWPGFQVKSKNFCKNSENYKKIIAWGNVRSNISRNAKLLHI